MNVFQSISSFLRKNKKVPERSEPVQPRRVSESVEGSSQAESDCTENCEKRVEEESVEGSELSEDNKDDIAFVRSTFRQSVKRAMGWRKSQRKAVNKRKKENIQNSKLLTGGNKDDDDHEFYDDTELDVVVVNEVDGIPTDSQTQSKRPSAPSSAKSSKIPKRRNSTKRPAVSLKSSGFFSQSVSQARPRKRPDSIRLRPAQAPWYHAEATRRSHNSPRNSSHHRTTSWSANQNLAVPKPGNEDQPRTRLSTWNGRTRNSNRNMSVRSDRSLNTSRNSLMGSQSRIPRYLGSVNSITSTASPSSPTSPTFPTYPTYPTSHTTPTSPTFNSSPAFLGLNMNLTDVDFSDSDTDRGRVAPWRNIEIVHSYSRSTLSESRPSSRRSTVSESRPSSRATSWSSTPSSTATGPQSRAATWGGRQTQAKNSRSTSSIRSEVVPSRTRSQSRIPRYLGSTTSMSSLSPMSTEYRVPGCDFDFADLDFDASDSSERTRCESMSKKSDGGKTVTARTNKAAELREVAIKKKLENTPGQSTTPEENIEMAPIPAPAARRKPRASFRTKKGIARRPLHKKEIKPAENKASQLRAKKRQEEAAEEEAKQKSEAKEPDARRSERFSSVAIKTPAPGTENRDPLSYMQNNRHESASRPRNCRSESKTESPALKTPGRATKSVPQKPVRNKTSSNTSSSTSSNIPSPSPRFMSTPPSLPLSKSNDDFQTRKYSGRSEKTSSSIPKPRLNSPQVNSPQVNSPQDPTKDLVFIPLDSVSLPLPSEKNKIDDMKRKRKIQRPSGVSNIFDGGAGDLPSSSVRRQLSTDDSDNSFTVHVNKTPAKSVTSTPKPRTSSISKTPVSSSLPNSSSIPSNLSSRLNSTGCVKNRAKPKPVQNLSTFKRQNSIESSRRSKKGISVIPRLSESNSLLSESTDPENSCSYESCRSVDEDVYLDSLPASPRLSESPTLPDSNIPIMRTPPVLISIDELESQKEKLRTPRKRSGSISVKKVRARKSWIRPDPEIIDPDVDKVKCALTDEVLIIEDLISGHQDIVQKLSSRTLVLKNVTSALRRSNVERAARMTVSLCFPRSHPDAEFKTMRRACQCAADDLALFQNCLSLLLVDRDKLTLPVVTILISKVRFTFEVLGTEVLRGNIGETLKLITGNYGAKIAHRDSTPGMNYRLHENAETCCQELLLVKNHVHKLTAVDYSPELLALKKTLELFDL